MADDIKREWFESSFDKLRNHKILKSDDHEISELYERSHLLAILIESKFVQLEQAMSPAIVKSYSDFFEKHNNNEIWKELKNRLPEGTSIFTPAQGMESVITRWDKNAVYTKPLGISRIKIDNEISKEYKTITTTEKDSIVKRRIGQSKLREKLLDIYGSKCAMCEVDDEILLRASHIVPWSEDEKNRLNVRNAILLCGIHDLAFENGIITIDSNYCLHINSLSQGSQKILSGITRDTLRLPENSIHTPDKKLLLKRKVG